MVQTCSCAVRLTVMAGIVLVGGVNRAEANEVDAGWIGEAMRLYNLDEEGAVERLAREVEAANTYRRVTDSQIRGYAGSWFDSESMRLKVALSSDEDAWRVRAMGAIPVFVSRSGDELEALRRSVADQIRELKPGALRSTHVDYPRNRVVLGISPARLSAIGQFLEVKDVDMEAVHIVAASTLPETSSGNVRGADGTRNLTYHAASGYTVDYPCSIGASVVGGYVTAGHCGAESHEMGASDNTPLGAVESSTWDSGTHRIDAGWVSTYGGWTPQAIVNGYADGAISISSAWSGNNPAPLYSTVCRYGQTSGGPHCGTIAAVGQDIEFCCSLGWILNLTVLSGSCSDDGDSGGTHMAAGQQVQGVNVGATTGNTCPTATTNVYLQPIADSLTTFSKVMLSSHGASAPTTSTVHCPDIGLSGYGNYVCHFDYFNSQGNTAIAWSSNTNNSSTSTTLFGTPD